MAGSRYYFISYGGPHASGILEMFMHIPYSICTFQSNATLMTMAVDEWVNNLRTSNVRSNTGRHVNDAYAHCSSS